MLRKGLFSLKSSARCSSNAAIATVRQDTPNFNQPPRTNQRASFNRRDSQTSRFNRRPNSHAVRDPTSLLIEKHRDVLIDVNGVDLFDFADKIDFADTTSYELLKKVLECLKNSSAQLKSFTDQRLGSLLSAAGEKSEWSSSLNFRRIYVKTLWDLYTNSPGLAVGIHTWNAYLEASMSTKQEVKPSEFLSSLEKNKLEPNETTYELLSSIYAESGNQKAVCMVVDEFNARGWPISQRLAESWVYMLAYADATQEARNVVDALNRNLNEFELHLSIVRAHAQKKQFDKVANCLAEIPKVVWEKVPVNQKIFHLIRIIGLLVQNNCPNAFELVRPYFASKTGEFFVPLDCQQILTRLFVECARVNNFSGALTFYRLFPSRYMKTSAQRIIREEVMVSTIKEMYTITSDANLFNTKLQNVVQWCNLLYAEMQASAPFKELLHYCGENTIELKNKLQPFYFKSKELIDFAKNDPERAQGLCYGYALAVHHDIRRSNYNIDKQSKILVEHFNDCLKLLPRISDILYRLTPTIQLLLDEANLKVVTDIFRNVERSADLFTCVVYQALNTDKMERLGELMNSKINTNGEIRVFIHRVITPLIQKLKAMRPNSHEELQTIAKVIAAGFTNGNDSTGGFAVGKIMAVSAINDEVLQRLIELLIDEPKVVVSKDEIRRIDSELRKLNLPARAELVQRLKRKNTAYSRWLESDISTLLKEAESLRSRPNVIPQVFCALFDVIVRKSIQQRPVDWRALHAILPDFHAQKSKLSGDELRSGNFLKTFTNAQSTAFVHALAANEWTMADELWNLRPIRNPEMILSYALSLCRRADYKRTDSLLSKLKESAATVDETTLEAFARSELLRTSSEEEVDEFLKKFAGHFHLSAESRHRLISAVQSQNLHRLITENNLDEAMKWVIRLDDALVFDIESSFVLVDLLKAAVVNENVEIFNSSKRFIRSKRDPNTAAVYIGIAFLELNDKRGKETLMQVDYIPSEYLRALIEREVQAKRVNVLHTLFNVLNNEKAGVELENLLEEVIRLYDLSTNADGLRTLYDEVRSSSLPLGTKLKVRFESAIKKYDSIAPSTATHTIEAPLNATENSK
ncbi:Leucine-rich PPR motif-containing protein, mitochondrial [Aphelenchoides besseyi]|nr:Leucine-rich PPR motif-containing protein, mitochondrial [Aphelenchoides besseyi]